MAEAPLVLATRVAKSGGNVVYAVNSYVWNSDCTNASYAFRGDLPAVNARVLAREAE
jgi:hypothetical protein